MVLHEMARHVTVRSSPKVDWGGRHLDRLDTADARSAPHHLMRRDGKAGHSG
jgi:hypothetical protein